MRMVYYCTAVKLHKSTYLTITILHALSKPVWIHVRISELLARNLVVKLYGYTYISLHPFICLQQSVYIHVYICEYLGRVSITKIDRRTYRSLVLSHCLQDPVLVQACHSEHIVHAHRSEAIQACLSPALIRSASAESSVT
jgi:hypothetical protein